MRDGEGAEFGSGMKRSVRTDGGETGARSVDGTDHDVETLEIEFDGSPVYVEVLSPRGWTAESVDPTGCGWVSDGGEHRACYYVDEVRGGSTLQIDGEVVERGLTKQEAATRLAEFAEVGPSDTETDHPGGGR